MPSRLIAFCLAGSLAALASAAAAEGTRAGGVTIHEPWVRASLGNTPTSAAYMRLEAEAGEADRLTGASTPAADRIEMHASTTEEGVARMRPLEAIEVTPGEAIELAPGGLHLMLVGLTEKLEQGQTVPLTLTFENAGEVTLEVPVKGVRAMSGHAGHGAGSN